jgi:phenylpyruvate tautomerase PptA (4-oxalocrotonate tautomerase family)|tara:strand:- start:417 stop:815 length:399 start_codon:yes stop_codon:yes gene_type:complete
MLANLIGPATQLLDKFIEDKDQKAALAHEISTMAERHAQELAKGQIEVNKMEAASSSMFVAGWRPAVGWICALGFASNFILIPMANFALALASIEVQIPMIDTTQMMPVLMGMLGLGTLRTVEKVRKVSREQ